MAPSTIFQLPPPASPPSKFVPVKMRPHRGQGAFGSDTTGSASGEVVGPASGVPVVPPVLVMPPVPVLPPVLVTAPPVPVLPPVPEAGLPPVPVLPPVSSIPSGWVLPLGGAPAQPA